MPIASFDHVVSVLQVSVTPVVLVSGIGLLLLSMTNRLGRVVDRARALRRDPGRGEVDRQGARRQMRLLYRRAQLLRAAIVAATWSLLLTAIMVLVLFMASLGAPLAGLVLLLFALIMVALVASLAFFLKDLTLSLQALRLELRPEL